MRTFTAHSNLWSIVEGSQWIDPSELLQAIKLELARADFDFRTAS